MTTRIIVVTSTMWKCELHLHQRTNMLHILKKEEEDIVRDYIVKDLHLIIHIGMKMGLVDIRTWITTPT